MTEQSTNPSEQERKAQQRTDASELNEELNRLAEAFSRAVQAAWRSDQRKQLQTNLNQGLTALVNSVEEILKDFGESEQGQEVREQAERVVERVRTSKVAADLQEGLTQGLRSVAEEMQEFAQRMESRQGDAPRATDEAQDIPVARAGDEETKPGDMPQV